MFCAKTIENLVWPEEPLPQIRARHAQEKWCRGRLPQSSQVFQKIFLQKKTPYESGSDSSTSSDDSEEPSHIIPRISVAVYPGMWFWLQNAKSL